MQIKFNVNGAKRKELVKAVGELLETMPVYKGAPTFAYQVGGYLIDKDGTLEGEDNLDLVADLEGLYSIKADSAEYDVPITYEESLGGLGALEDVPIPYEAALGGRVSPYRDFAEPPAYGIHESDTLTIELPKSGFSDTAIDNLRKVVESKAELIKKALGSVNLEIEVTENTIRFPWFTNTDGEAVKAYTHFISALCELAKTQKRVNAVPRSADNEKYAFRCFLLRLGFIGPEYRAERKILLSNLTGSSAFKNDVSGETE